MNAPLGPLQERGATGVLTFQISEKPAGAVQVVQTYTVSGGRPGLAKEAAAPVDAVLADQLKRYAKYLETGKPQ